MSLPMACLLAGQGKRLIGSILQGIPVHHWHNVASGDQTAVVSLWVGVASLIIAIAGL